MKRVKGILAGLRFFMFLGILNFVAIKASAQGHFAEDPETGLFIHSKVIFIDSTSKDELYKRAEYWLQNPDESGIEGFEVQDKANGKISINGTKTIVIKQKGEEIDVPLYYTLNVYVKGNRCKYEFTNISLDIDGKGKTRAEKCFRSKNLDNKESQCLSKTKRLFVTMEKSFIASITNNSTDVIVRRFKLE